MTEVRQGISIPSSIQSTNFGLYATQDYNEGDVILVEQSPLIQLSSDQLSPHEQEWVESIVDQKPKATSGPNGGVACSKEVDFGSPKLKAMVQVGLYFVLHIAKSNCSWKDDKTSADVRQLYHPPISLSDPTFQEVEREIVELSLLTLESIRSVLRNYVLASNEDSETRGSVFYTQIYQAIRDLSVSADSSGDNCLDSDLELHPIIQEMMLIWACNSFNGGRIYRIFSRINHSCNPNAVVVVPNEVSQEDFSRCNQQKLVAGCDIKVGDEICISYLQGPLLYADNTTRRKVLLQDKFFECCCERCTTSIDRSSAIPCPVCHPRESHQSIPSSSEGIVLAEDVQYDDDQDVHYVYYVTTPSEIPYQLPVKLSECLVCQKVFGDVHRKPQLYKKLIGTHESIVEKVVAFFRIPNIVDTMKGNKSSVASNHDPACDDEAEASIVIHAEQLEQLLRLSSSVMGAKHWTTNMLLLLQLNQALTQLNARAVLNATGSDPNEEKEDIETSIAEAIDMLERVVRFVEGLQLKLHMGHLLSTVIVGTARALVSLGDVKSQKYAAKWLDKIVEFVDKFESAGVQAVVHRLHVAWQRDAQDEDSRPEKRAKR